MSKKYVYTEDMEEISGFGGDYEEACRAMVVAGLEFLDQNPELNPDFRAFKAVYGIISEENEDAKRLSTVVSKAAEGCTGAMHQAAITHILWIRQNGWDKYCEEMTKEWTGNKFIKRGND